MGGLKEERIALFDGLAVSFELLVDVHAERARGVSERLLDATDRFLISLTPAHGLELFNDTVRAHECNSPKPIAMSALIARRLGYNIICSY